MINSSSRKFKKKPSLNYNQMSPFHSNMIKKSKNPNFKGITKQTYSSFLIKMLDETPTNFNKSIRKISKTAYKNLFKKKTGFNPFNTNYSLSKKRDLSSFEKALSKIEKKVIKKNEYLNEYKNKSIMDPKKQKNKTKNFLNEMGKKNIIIKNNSSHNFISTLTKENKTSKNSFNNLKQKRLDDLYGYDSNFIKSKNHLLRKKDSFGLDKYQNEVLKISQRNLSKDYMMKLFTELQSIKRDADLVKPLPPINYRALITHCFKKDDDKKNEMDEYEKELYYIKKSNTFKREKTQRNKRMYKIYEILPEYVIDALYKKRNKPINL